MDNAKVIQFIKDFYANYVFGEKNYIPTVKKHCTAKLQKQLKDNYEYDGEGYAIWDFRTGAQDGPSDVCKVTSVAVLANGFYKVDFIDMGIKGNRTLKIVNENGTLIRSVQPVRFWDMPFRSNQTLFHSPGESPVHCTVHAAKACVNQCLQSDTLCR